LFVPAAVETSAPAPVPADPEGKQPRKPGRSSGMIEVEIDGVTVRVFNFEQLSPLFVLN
jgi:hypothetical protein